MRLPIMVTLMQTIKQTLAVNPHSYENVLHWAVCCTGFGFGCAEFLTPDDAPLDPQVHMSPDDLAYRHTATPMLQSPDQGIKDGPVPPGNGNSAGCN